jgi:flagellar hook-basal body complex protein FliE
MTQITVGPINPNLQLPEVPGSRKLDGSEKEAGFGQILRDAITTTNDLQKQSNKEIEKLITGEAQDLHETMIAVQKADLSFQMMMQVRNKLLQAYQEIMRMQL